MSQKTLAHPFSANRLVGVAVPIRLMRPGYRDQEPAMIERQQELKRRHHRKKKMKKLKAKLIAGATGEDREKILYKIKRLSPWWTESSLGQKATSAKTAAEAPEKKAAPKPKAPAKPRPEKK